MFLQLIEYMSHIVEAYKTPDGKAITDIVVITDLKGFTLAQVLQKNMIEFCRVLLDILQVK